MRNLQKLDMSTNQLSSLPSSMGRLSTLQVLDVSSNRLTSLPPSIGFLQNMKVLDCRYNEINESARPKLEDNIVRALEFLREEQERQRLAEIDRNKPKGSELGPYTVYTLKYAKEDLEMQRCRVRSGHSVTAADEYTFVFGGLREADNVKTDELFYLHVDRLEASGEGSAGDALSPLVGGGSSVLRGSLLLRAPTFLLLLLLLLRPYFAPPE